MRTKHLKSGRSNYCPNCAQERRRQWGFDNTGVDLDAVAGMIVHRSYIKRVRLRAVTEGMDFQINHQDIEQMLIGQNFKCALSGVPISFASSTLSNKQANLQHTASLNRIDSKRGFTIDNVWWLHKDIGSMKMDLPKDRFVELCRLVARAAA